MSTATVMARPGAGEGSHNNTAAGPRGSSLNRAALAGAAGALQVGCYRLVTTPAPATAMRSSRARHAAIVAASVCAVLPAAAAAQYPLVATPVIPLGTLSPSIKLGGYVSVRDTKHGDSTSFAVNRARLSAMIAPLPYLAVRVQVDFSGNQTETVSSSNTVHGFELTDAYVEVAQAVADSARWGQFHPALIVGQFKQPFSLEYLTSFAYLRTANRATAIDQLTPKRDIGAMGQVQWSHFVTADASVTNGEGANAVSNPDGRELLIGRVTVTPFTWLALAAKLGNEGTDHLRGYDGRIMWRDLLMEGEAFIDRGRSAATIRTPAEGMCWPPTRFCRGCNLCSSANGSTTRDSWTARTRTRGMGGRPSA